MPIILGYSLFFDQKDNPTVEDLYRSLCQDLKAEIADLLGLHDSPAMLDDWPNANWSNAHGSATVESTEWTTEADPDGFKRKLLKVQFIQHLRDYSWVVDLKLGCIRKDDVVLTGEWSISSFKPIVPFEEMPELLTFAPKYTCHDEDGLLAGKTYLVSEDRVASFADFIKSPERQSPIILISRPSSNAEYLLTEIGAMARKVQGLAHVIKLADDRTAQRLRSLLPRHSCYNGAVRIFWPGFRTEDDPALHPFWHRNKLKTTEEEFEARRDIFARIADESPRIFSKSPDIGYLERRQSEEKHEKRLAQLKERLREQERSAFEVQRDARQRETDWEELFTAYEVLEGERESLRQRNHELEHENRRLRWQLTGDWPSEQQLGTDDEQAVAGAVLLSRKARKRYSSFSSNERDYWNEHLLGKLLNEKMRDNQSEPIHGPNGTCFAYPRSGTGDARRLIYYQESDRIYVCELFPGAEHDKDYDRLRNRGVDRHAYNGFEQWQV